VRINLVQSAAPPLTIFFRNSHLRIVQSGIRGKPDEPALLYIVFFTARRKMYEDKWTAKLLGER